MCLTIIYSIFFSYSTNKIESPCANPRYNQSLKSFSYLLTAVLSFRLIFLRLRMVFVLGTKSQLHSHSFFYHMYSVQCTNVHLLSLDLLLFMIESLEMTLINTRLQGHHSQLTKREVGLVKGVVAPKMPFQ